MKQSRRPAAKRTDLKKDVAAALAIGALGFIAGDPEQLGHFLALSGIGPDSLRAAAGEPNFLLGVLEHVTGDEALLVAFAGHNGIDPTEVARARDVLAGGTSEVP